MADTPQHFTRDTNLAADVADQFGGGAGNAEQLIEANNLRYSAELVAAQLRPGESGINIDLRRDEEYSKADVAKASDLEEDQILSFDRHGDYVVYLFESADGRVHKDVLLEDDGDLEAPETADSPQRAAIRASVAASDKVKEAKTEADQILADARAEADKILAEAAGKAEEERVESIEKAQKADSEDEPSQPKKAASPRPKNNK